MDPRRVLGLGRPDGTGRGSRSVAVDGIVCNGAVRKSVTCRTFTRPAVESLFRVELDPRTLTSVAAYDQHAEAYQQAFRMSRRNTDVRRFADMAERDTVVLDVACGPASDLRLLSDVALHPIGVDLSLGALKFARLLQPRTGLIQAAIHDIPVKPKSVGGLWMSSAFTHLPRAQWRETFSALLGHLKAGPVYFSCYLGQADMEELSDQVLGTVHRSQATEDEVEGMFLGHGIKEVQIDIRPDPIVGRRRPWVVALGRG